MPRVQKVEGFVLKKKELLEQDLLVTIFSKEFGKIVSIAKGVRKLTSRRAAHLQTGNLISVQISEFHEMYYIQSSDLISGFLQIKTEQKVNVLYLFLFILDKLLPERQEESDLYTITRKFFIKLSNSDVDPISILHNTLQETLAYLGYVQNENSLEDLFVIVENNIEEKLPRHVIM